MDDKEIVMACMKNCGDCLECASKRLKDDEEVVITAVKNNVEALKYASTRLKNNKEIAMLAVSKDSQAIKYIGKNIRKDIDVVSALKKRREKELEWDKKERERAKTDPKIIEAAKSVRAYLLYYKPELLDEITCEDWNEMKKKVKSKEFYNPFKRR